MKHRFVAAAFFAFVGLGLAVPAQAQQFGVQLNWADDVDLGIGARAQFALGSILGFEGDDPLAGLQGVASVDYYLWNDCTDCTYFEINGNALYPVDIGNETFSPYFGGGLNISHISVGNFSETDPGLNILGGAGFPLAGLDTFAEAKIEIGGGEQFVLTFGALFGGGN